MQKREERIHRAYCEAEASASFLGLNAEEIREVAHRLQDAADRKTPLRVMAPDEIQAKLEVMSEMLTDVRRNLHYIRVNRHPAPGFKSVIDGLNHL